MERAIVRVRWNDVRAIEQAAGVLREHGCVQLDLPADFHHAVYRHIHPRADQGSTEIIDTRGGAELLSAVAEIRHLSDLASLTELVAQAGGTVHIQSPAPRILILLPQKTTAG